MAIKKVGREGIANSKHLTAHTHTDIQKKNVGTFAFNFLLISILSVCVLCDIAKVCNGCCRLCVVIYA